MKVKKEACPETEAIKNALPKIDFTDTFATTNPVDDLRQLSTLIFAYQPKWIQALLGLRHFLVGSIGLKTKVPEDHNPDFVVGGYMGFFKIFGIYDTELLLGVDDKHLNFRVSIYNSKTPTFNIKVTTLVQYNTSFGRVYMNIVKPFHYVLVKTLVKNAYKI